MGIVNCNTVVPLSLYIATLRSLSVLDIPRWRQRSGTRNRRRLRLPSDCFRYSAS